MDLSQIGFRSYSVKICEFTNTIHSYILHIVQCTHMVWCGINANPVYTVQHTSTYKMFLFSLYEQWREINEYIIENGCNTTHYRKNYPLMWIRYTHKDVRICSFYSCNRIDGFDEITERIFYWKYSWINIDSTRIMDTQFVFFWNLRGKKWMSRAHTNFILYQYLSRYLAFALEFPSNI